MKFCTDLVVVCPERDGLEGGQQPVIHQARLQVLPGSHVVQQNLNTGYSRAYTPHVVQQNLNTGYSRAYTRGTAESKYGVVPRRLFIPALQ
jgi:hypothetical protein